MNLTPSNHHSSTSAFIAELGAYPQFVAWQYEARGTDKPAKAPICPATGRKADVQDPTTWGSFGAAMDRLRRDDLPGLGFVLTADDPYTVTDLDNCVDAAGNPSEWARGIVTFLASYTELSPSGTGLHIWTRAELPLGRRKRKDSGIEIEMYDKAHYLTLTLDPLPGTPAAIMARGGEVGQLHAVYLGQATPAAAQPPAATAPTLADEDLVRRILRSRIGPQFALLWSGETAGYPSPSEADLALAGYLAFWTQDAAQLDRLFRSSGLYRPEKWDAGREVTYGARTIKRAIANRAGTYDPHYREARP